MTSCSRLDRFDHVSADSDDSAKAFNSLAAHSIHKLVSRDEFALQ